MFEDPRFEAGTRTVAEAVADCRGFRKSSVTPSAVERARRTGRDGVISSRSYLPIAWGVTMLSRRLASSRSE